MVIERTFDLSEVCKLARVRKMYNSPQTMVLVKSILLKLHSANIRLEASSTFGTNETPLPGE